MGKKNKGKAFPKYNPHVDPTVTANTTGAHQTDEVDIGRAPQVQRTQKTPYNSPRINHNSLNQNSYPKFKPEKLTNAYGQKVQGKKFRKEKGKKKRCPNSGARIDGAIKSIRLDA